MAGWCVNFLKKAVKVPVWARVDADADYPAAGILIVGFVMFFLIGGPVAAVSLFNLTIMLRSMQGGSGSRVWCTMGAMAAFDFGGPVNKVASLFADGLLLQGVYGPEAIKICASMIPPFGVTLSWLLRKKRYSKGEAANIKVAFPLGICMITEGVIPIAAVVSAARCIFLFDRGSGGRSNHYAAWRRITGSFGRHVYCAGDE